MTTRALAAILFLSLAGGAHAELRDYCPDRPGIGSPSCTIDRGHVSAEVGIAGWTLDKTAGARDDTLILGDMLARFGLGDATEFRLGWTGYGRQRDRDATGATRRQHRVGDVTLALRQNLRNPDGSGLSFAVTPFVTLPVGRQPIGAGDWGAGLAGALSLELNDSIALAFTPEADAAVDEDGRGRHFAYSLVEGINAKLNEGLTMTIEHQVSRDRDPAGHSTTQLAGLSFGWMRSKQLQLDMGANAGLNQHSPDIELYVGISRRF